MDFPVAESSERLRVVTYNIQNGGASRIELIGSVIQSCRPTAVALLEASDLAAVSDLAQRLQMNIAFGPANTDQSVAWLSSKPLLGVQNYRLPALSKTLLRIDIEWVHGPLALYATHLANLEEEHEYPRHHEVRAILETIESLREHAHLIVGDFNSLRPHDRIGKLPTGMPRRGDAVHDSQRKAIGLLVAAGYTDCYRHLHATDDGFTYPSGAPWLRLDYLFASRLMSKYLVNSNTVHDRDAREASDHLPVWAEFSSE